MMVKYMFDNLNMYLVDIIIICFKKRWTSQHISDIIDGKEIFMEIMHRKLVVQSGRAFNICIPLSYIKANGLVKGDEMRLEINGNTLILTPSEQAQKRKLGLTDNDIFEN